MTRYWKNGSLTVLRATALEKNKSDQPQLPSSPLVPKHERQKSRWFSTFKKDETSDSAAAAAPAENHSGLSDFM